MAVLTQCKTSGVRIKAAQRALKVVQLRVDGLSQVEIARRLKISVPRVCQILKKCMARHNGVLAETVEEARRIDLERCDRLFADAYAKALKNGNDKWKAHAACKHWLDQRAKLLGLYVERHLVKVEESYELNVVARIEEYAEALAAGPAAVQGDIEGDGGGEPIPTPGANGQAGALPDLRG
jgi:hypothetical protein